MLYFAEDVDVHFEDEGGLIGFFFNVLRVLEVAEGEGGFFQEDFLVRRWFGNLGLRICSDLGVRDGGCTKKRWWDLGFGVELQIGAGV